MKDDADAVVHESATTEKTMSRGAHLELLVFELLMLIEHIVSNFNQLDAMSIYESDAYAEVRVLYKALAHNRRPDGTRY